jgi:hypothetical protein
MEQAQAPPQPCRNPTRLFYSSFVAWRRSSFTRRLDRGIHGNRRVSRAELDLAELNLAEPDRPSRTSPDLL